MFGLGASSAHVLLFDAAFTFNVTPRSVVCALSSRVWPHPVINPVADNAGHAALSRPTGSSTRRTCVEKVNGLSTLMSAMSTLGQATFGPRAGRIAVARLTSVAPNDGQ